MNLENQADKTVLSQFARLSVDVNGLTIPGRSIESVLARHAFNLVVNNDDEIFKVSLIGSATAVRFRGRDILLTTQHQLGGVDMSQVAMLTDSGSHIITSGGSRGYDPHPDSDAHDIVAFDFTEPCKDWPVLKKRFFELTRRPPDVPNDQVLAILLSGYPSDDQTYEVHENNHLGLARRHVACLPHSQPSDQALLTVQAVRPLKEHPDGMSGGPAFVIQLEVGGPRAYFAGIILRGGRTYFHILKAGFVFEFLNSAFG
ncbi:hypothetical protein C5748_07375 [Phyllobacterium phragmitis]|uniref:Serine protease n=1 Tax=Phyllobacterium phragmitis TaxID=2670329 RepID=A0A2S9IV57_9HYPH|nr:hypothetical protein [Phyllobacterium phragmitis]PRD44391.1 hypothetical protein C5748_07375 [Phyllobacterium phragmitis]